MKITQRVEPVIVSMTNRDHETPLSVSKTKKDRIHLQRNILSRQREFTRFI